MHFIQKRCIYTSKYQCTYIAYVYESAWLSAFIYVYVCIYTHCMQINRRLHLVTSSTLPLSTRCRPPSCNLRAYKLVTKGWVEKGGLRRRRQQSSLSTTATCQSTSAQINLLKQNVFNRRRNFLEIPSTACRLSHGRNSLNNERLRELLAKYYKLL